MTDSPPGDKLQFLSEVIVTANHSFIRWHGRDSKHRYNYLYTKQELNPWVNKIKKISLETPVVRGYFNNHYGAKSIANGLEFRELLGESLSEREIEIKEKINDFYRSKQLVLDNSDVKVTYLIPDVHEYYSLVNFNPNGSVTELHVSANNSEYLFASYTVFEFTNSSGTLLFLEFF
jgi:hypothetical protein